MNYLEQYYQKGGTYAIPVEVINQISVEFEELEQEIERLHSIIKEVREYIKERTEFGEYTYAYPGVLNQDEVREINRILDKENKE